MSHPSSPSSFADSTPDQLRALVLDYLCHSCYTRTASAFAKDCTVHHLDADGDEIIGPADHESPTSPGGLTPPNLEKLLKEVQLREEIKKEIMSGHVDDAIALLDKHFPSVLSEVGISATDAPSVESRPNTNNIDYVSSTSTEPSHLLLNLRILAFCEACRTIPLGYPDNGILASLDSEMPDPDQGLEEIPEDDEQQLSLLTRAQKLYAFINTLQNPLDHATYMKELENVGGLLAYKVPEKSSMAKYLTLERREAVADQINRAILKRIGSPLISTLEFLTRRIHVLWQYANQDGVKSRPGAVLPPKSRKAVPAVDGESEVVPIFDLRNFLDSKP